MKLIEKTILRDLSISKEKLELPIIGIYFLFDNVSLVYIGSSFDCKKRIYQHIQQKEKEFSSYTIIPLNEWILKNSENKNLKPYLLKIESEYIFKYKPKYNKQLTPNKEMQYLGTIENYNPKIYDKPEFAVINGKVYCKYRTKEK